VFVAAAWLGPLTLGVLEDEMLRRWFLPAIVPSHIPGNRKSYRVGQINKIKKNPQGHFREVWPKWSGVRAGFKRGRLGAGVESQEENNERSEDAGVLAHTCMVVKAMPNEGIALVCRRVDRSGIEERRKAVEIQDEPVLAAKHLIAHKRSGVPPAFKAHGLASVPRHLDHRTDRE